MRSALATFDALDNRREVMILLERLGSNQRRRAFLESLIPLSLKGFAGAPLRVCGACNAVTSYFLLVGLCNEIGVSIDDAARRLEEVVRWFR